MTSCSAWSSLSVCQWQNCILITVFGEDNFIVVGTVPLRICRLLLSGEKHIRFVQSEIVRPNPKLIMNWYFPSLPFYSVRGDIDIHASQQALCQFPSVIQICSEWSTNPLSSAGCEDDSPSCLKRKLQEQYTRGSSLILRDVSAQDIVEQFQPNEVFPSISLFSWRSAYRLSRNVQLDTRAWSRRLCSKRTHADASLQCAFGGIPLQTLTLRP